MKQQKRIVGAGLVTLMVSTAVLWWACDFEKVSPTESLTTKVSDVVRGYRGVGTLSETKLATILEKLAYCQTQEQAVEAINLLLEKTGIRRLNTPLPPPAQQNQYAVFLLSDADIAKLAAWHLCFVLEKDILEIGGKPIQVNPLSMAKTFAIYKIATEHIDQDFKFSGDPDKVFKKFQLDATKALRDPEDPNNAVLATIAADGAELPTTIARLKPNTILSPVQSFLYTLWLTVEYGELKATPAPVKARDLCILRCLSSFLIDVFLCQFELTQKQKAECMQAIVSNFKDCVESCLHDQGSGS